ncbi:MAG: IS66 family insertion sequence element accessory protein TnpB [Opitutae bacterium]|nr:IS66 family insertion sequence element accessory protein TnpB [Opitutae bacterium]
MSVAQRADYVRAYRESGLNQMAFAKREGLRYSTFAHWVQKAAKGELRVSPMSSSREGAMQFAQVQFPAAVPTTASLEVRLSDGVVVRGDDGIYVAVQPVDMRKQFNGLWSAVAEQLEEDPRSGAVFCFINQSRTRLKMLYWDGSRGN